MATRMKQQHEPEHFEPVDMDEIVKATVSAAEIVNATERAQIDIQLESAKKFPRNVLRFQTELKALACVDRETAEGMFYSLPRKERGKVKYISGPSIRFAELAMYCWGNMRSDARVVAIEETHIVAQGTCLDLERNTGSRMEVRRKITNSAGTRYNDDMIVVTGNAACSVAQRNAIFDVIPFALVKGAYNAAVKMATGGDQPIEAMRSGALAYFAKLGVDETRVLNALGVASTEKIGEEQITVLAGLKTAIQDGDTTTDEAFPRAGSADLNAALKAKGDPAPDPARTAAGQLYQHTLHRLRPDLNESGFERRIWLETILGEGRTDEADFTVAEFNAAIKALESGDGPQPEREPGEDDG